ncbi:amino acid ABC transporter substrate-binding protein [Pseudomonas monteilii]|uniref:amino acid ABC transporter substrate-binding protein n=1 Tax=Pseudomonas monteilii TaxID=76759 RepID=UPI003CFD555B
MVKNKIFSYALVLAAQLGAAGYSYSGTLDTIAERNSITFGVREASVPFSYADDSGKSIGYTVEICNKIADAVRLRLGRPELLVKYHEVTGATKIPLMANGTIDLECSTTTNTLPRQNQVSFSSTTFLSSNVFMAKKSSGLKRIDDLKGKTVVSISGSTNMQALVKLNADKKLGLRVIAARDLAEAFLMLDTDRAAALVQDDSILVGVIASSGKPQDFTLSEDSFGPPEPYAIMIRKDDPEFKKLVDDAIAEYFKSEAGQLNYNRWFVDPIPPRGYKLNFPMGQALKKVYASPTDSPDVASY